MYTIILMNYRNNTLRAIYILSHIAYKFNSLDLIYDINSTNLT